MGTPNAVELSFYVLMVPQATVRPPLRLRTNLTNFGCDKEAQTLIQLPTLVGATENPKPTLSLPYKALQDVNLTGRTGKASLRMVLDARTDPIRPIVRRPGILGTESPCNTLPSPIY